MVGIVGVGLAVREGWYGPEVGVETVAVAAGGGLIEGGG